MSEFQIKCRKLVFVAESQENLKQQKEPKLCGGSPMLLGTAGNLCYKMLIQILAADFIGLITHTLIRTMITSSKWIMAYRLQL